MASFPSAPTGVEATDEAGAKTTAAVDATGGFSLALVKGHTYRLDARLGSTTVPFVFPRGGGRLDKTIKISTNGAMVALGAVTHFAAAPPTGFSTTSESKQCEFGEDGKDDNADGECEDGKDAITGAACTDEDGSGGADPTKPMAVPEHNAPADVAGCKELGDGDGEENDD